MLSAESKRRATKEEFTKHMDTIFAVEKYKKLHDFQAKRIDFKITKVKEEGDVSKDIDFTFNRVVHGNGFLDKYDELIVEKKSDDPNVIFSEANQLEYKEMWGHNLLDETKDSLDLVKEDGEWKIKINDPKRFLNNRRYYEAFVSKYLKEEKQRKKEAEYNAMMYREVIAKQISREYRHFFNNDINLAKAYIDCVISKTGDVTFGEVKTKYTADQRMAFSQECIK